LILKKIVSGRNERNIKLQGTDKSLTRPTSRYVLFYGENISFDVSLVTYINSTNIPTIMIINKTHETQIFWSYSWFSSWSG